MFKILQSEGCLIFWVDLGFGASTQRLLNYDIIKRKRTVKFKMWIFVPTQNK